MYCPKCGSNVPNDAKFCTFCGEPLEGGTFPESQPIQPISPMPTPYQAPLTTPSKKSKTSGGAVLDFLVVIVIGILLIYFGFRSISSVPSTGITMLIIGAIIILSLTCCLCGGGRGGGWGVVACCDFGGCDCGDCDC